jgi:hypothetical protein
MELVNNKSYRQRKGMAIEHAFLVDHNPTQYAYIKQIQAIDDARIVIFDLYNNDDITKTNANRYLLQLKKVQKDNISKAWDLGLDVSYYDTIMNFDMWTV